MRRFANTALSSGEIDSVIPVSIGPGQTQFTVMPSRPSSTASDRVRRRIRAGNINLNGVPNERTAPFGGYKQSGNGREWGKFGLEEYLEVTAIAGFAPA